MGAWDFGNFKYGMDGRNDTRLGFGIVFIKQELIYNGYTKGIDPSLPYFGDAVRNRTTEFQQDHGLAADGQVGWLTSRELLRKRIGQVEKKYDLIPDCLGKQIQLESRFDPIALGVVDPSDTGLAQINLRIHSSVSQEEAYDPSFSLDWSARYIRSAFDEVARKADVMKAARAAYNIGNTYATQWMLAGFPDQGGPVLGDQDSFTRATNYIALIDKQVY